MSQSIERLKVLSSGIFSLILTLGIARFAYTPLLPIMQEQAGLGISEGGWVASINYAGYLCGAVIASLVSNLIIKDRLYRIGLIIAVVTTAGMGLTENIWLWAMLRFLAGLSSAAGLLLGSGLILNWLIRHGHRSELGIHFSGLGLGIAFCALSVELMSRYFDWSQQWFLLTLMGLLFLFPAWKWLPSPDNSTLTNSGQLMSDSPPGHTFMRLFMAAYFCAGVGYVISATFIVAIIEQLPGLEGKGAWNFMVLGLAAAPACIIWDLVARRVGYFNALITAYLMQALGICLPALEPSLMLSLSSAVLFGGTFIGIVSLVLTMAGRYYPTRPAKMMGKITIFYGIAQILAPALTGILTEQTGSYSDALYAGAVIMVLGSLLMLKLKALNAQES
ncbi:MAG: YbfB/YjiJ family MFS transporter [gamma proteobacterium symbiont of Bathyaustriella thionipta]|nr:YbfB/YjiJ family MFS transporter [gamma proteobacterium symbiont of Bathyaustriella thionipta]MCU7949715.1 YbfB/YjiJ family MFS transporter [gamma proteobacterium symbiont of Bathyaustriella thionipta]MCU7952917.1 YbfB/YjiJ family MFS transporter [gamma proteobacterium symbiont of Bathyaustriella thionipta]MCU7956423.1 YbfB/YjiJ family MFS transporter [gamma proteobacterium symbiont of Bathyaustriella thionipta]MCU7967534.1 YbfB/YjiJ family MFS transporter [gamma proteobacterium symbiont of 